jgi:hypothetical protein
MAVEVHHARQLTPQEVAPPPLVDKLRRRWFGVAGIGLIFSLGLLLLKFRTDNGIQEFMRAYLVGFIFCFGLMLGSTALMMLYHVVGGKWGLVILRMLEAGSRTWFLVVLMFVPIALNLHHLYPWAGAADLDVHGKHALNLRADYLNVKAFLARAAFYFLAWGAFIYFFNKWTRRLDEPPASPEAYDRQRLRFMRLGGGGVLFYAISLTLAAVDWVMSLDPIWFSTIWGMLYMGGQALSAMAFMLVVLAYLVRVEPMHSVLRKSELFDNGKLLLAFVMLYTYLSFSQFIIIWSGNLPEEIRWYLARTQNGWKPVMITLVLIHFVVPFLLLLNRDLKKLPTRLAGVAMLILVARVGESYWQIIPNFADASGLTGHFSPNLFDLIVPIALAAIWVATFFYQLGKRPLLPIYHHLMPEVLEKQHGAH